MRNTVRKTVVGFVGKSVFRNECCICLEQFEPGSKVDVLACHPHHMLHEDCYNVFVASNEAKGNRLVCPMCRKPVDKQATRKKVLQVDAKEDADPFQLDEKKPTTEMRSPPQGQDVQLP